MTNIDFVVSFMFMTNIFYKTKQMTEYLHLQGEEVDILDATIILESKIGSLRQIRDEKEAMDAQIFICQQEWWISS